MVALSEPLRPIHATDLRTPPGFKTYQWPTDSAAGWQPHHNLLRVLRRHAALGITPARPPWRRGRFESFQQRSRWAARCDPATGDDELLWAVAAPSRDRSECNPSPRQTGLSVDKNDEHRAAHDQL